MINKSYFFFLILFSVSLLAQSGSIRGIITDEKTKEPMFGVNVIVKGTYYGASSDAEGKYAISNVTPGTYTVEVSLIGYTTLQFTGIKVQSGKVTELPIKMNETVLTINQDVVIVGEKPLVDVEETQSKKTLSREDIEMAQVENVSDLVTQSTGVVKSDNAIHIRGGRAYENAYLLDGVSVQDPLAGTGFGLQLSANAIEEIEIITGGYNAEFGQATSGVVNVKTRDGDVERYRGYISYKTDKVADLSSPHVFNIDVLEMNLSGPEPLTKKILPALGIDLPGDLSFFGNFYAGLSNGITQGLFKPKTSRLNSSTFYGTRFAPKVENNYFGMGKFTYKATPTMKFSYAVSQSVGINQNSQSLQSNLEYVEPSPGYQYEFQNILSQANVFTHKNLNHTFSLTHTLNNSTFYDLRLSYFYTNLRADANGTDWRNYREPLDIPNYPVEYYNLTGDTIGVIPGDGFWDVGNPFTWRDHYVREYAFKFDLTSFFDEKNKFKSGMQLQFQEMQVVEIYKPWVGDLGLNNDIYKVYPALGSFYAQDNINFGGMILNFGLRLDFWFPGKFVDDAIDNPDVVTIPDELRPIYKDESIAWFNNRYLKARLSPRLGISHPITDNQTLFFSYGHFSKWPKPQFVYAKLSPYNAQSSFQKFGNPNLKPETTVAYEMGVKTQFSMDDVLTITAYYKDIYDYVSTRRSKITSPRFSANSFITYVNSDYARSRGIEFEYRKRLGKWFTGLASFTYSEVTGKSSSADEGVLVEAGDIDEAIKEEFMPWDRPITATISTNFFVRSGEPIFGLGEGILDDYNLNLRFFYQSGKRYTPANFTGNYTTNGRPIYESDRTNRYGELGDDWFWVDLNFEKYIKFSGLNFTVFVEVNNLLDRYNSAIINPVTGRAYETGDPTPNSYNDPKYPDLQAPISPYPYDPARYLTRRNVKVGVSVKF